MCIKRGDPSQGTTDSVQCLRRGPIRPRLWMAMALSLAEIRVPAPARHAAALCFITYQFLLKRKPYKFNQLFIWKHLTFFFPLELFDIIVLRVRIKKKKVKMCDNGGHSKTSISGRSAGLISSRLES